MGQDKALVRVGGSALLARGYAAVQAARTVVVVAPDDTVRAAFPGGVPRNLVQTMEDPPRGGPAAGILAGIDRLTDDPAPWTAILACDLPHASRIVEALLVGLDTGADADVFCAVDEAGREQLLMGIYSREFLLGRRDRIGTGRGLAVRALMEGARAVPVAVDGRLATDIDTPDELRAAVESMEES